MGSLAKQEIAQKNELTGFEYKDLDIKLICILMLSLSPILCYIYFSYIDINESFFEKTLDEEVMARKVVWTMGLITIVLGYIVAFPIQKLAKYLAYSSSSISSNQSYPISSDQEAYQAYQRQVANELFSSFRAPLSSLYGILTSYPPELFAETSEAEIKRLLLPFVEFICEVRGQPARETLDYYGRNQPGAWPQAFFNRFPFSSITETDINAVGFEPVRRLLLDVFHEPFRIYPDNDFVLPDNFIRERIREHRQGLETINRERRLLKSPNAPVLPVFSLRPEDVIREQFGVVMRNKHNLFYSDFERFKTDWKRRLDRECPRGLAHAGTHLVFGVPPENANSNAHYYAIPDAYACAVPYGEPLFRHTYIVGKTGSGKTTLLKNLIAQHIRNGQGLVILSPENKLFDEILDYVPPERARDVVYFDPVASEAPFVSFSPFAREDGEALFERTGEVYAVLESALGDLGDSMKTLLNKCVYTLLQRPGSTLQDINRLLKPNGDFRQTIIQDTRIDRDTREWWRDTYEAKGSLLPKSADAILRRLDAFFMPPLSQTLARASFSLSEALNEQKSIFLFNLSRLKGQQAEVCGQLVISSILQTLLTRDRFPESSFLPYHLVIDEFQTYAGTSSKSFIDMFNRARKYKMSVTLAHQITANIPSELLSTVIGNAGTKVVMERPSEDAAFFAKELQLKTPDRETFNASALQNLHPHEFFLVTPHNKNGVLLKTPFDLCEKVSLPIRTEALPDELRGETLSSFDDWRNAVKRLSSTRYGQQPPPEEESPDFSPINPDEGDMENNFGVI